ncbi:MAG: hypothetical protein VYA67_22155 [Actinomycetota bacterium]|nr:hypothetical protein [Actinomycetota bacterium]
MAREHARIWLDINSDDDFEQLPFDAQGLYCRVILTLDDLSYCGVADWRPKRLTTKAPDLPFDRIMSAAANLEIGRYCLFDLDTEEVLARSYIRRDELLRNPKMAAAVVKAYPGIASKMLRAAVVTEIQRVWGEHPEYSSWGHPDVGPALSKLMAKQNADDVPYVPQIVGRMRVDMVDGIRYRITNGIGDSEAVRITNGEAVPIGNPVGDGESVPIPSTYTSTPTPAPLEGYVSTEAHQSDNPDTNPPSPFCPRHPNGTKNACRPCRAAREAREAWDAKQLAATERRRAEFWSEVRACPDCDDNGQTETEAGRIRRCHNHDWTVINP